MELCTYKVNITGTVQGVGFRPFIYALTQRYLLTGTVSNNSNGVEIILNADSLTFQQFLTAVEYEYPPLASIEKISYKEFPYREFDDFQIIETREEGDVTVNIPPDVSICSACEKELFDPSDRRYGYPFITCTHCGVRYSVIYDLPYDRVNTSMKFFQMCKACEEEYINPSNRRYHAQPIGCWECGPSLKLVGRGVLSQTEVIDETATLLKQGNIVAVKGVGGYHLMCDASNEDAVMKLRKRKHRPSKPFAVMVRDITMAREFAEISPKEEALLTSKERPIVLLKTQGSKLSAQIAPNISYIGLFLPYTPLHLLLLDKLKRPLVATSANVTDEPICTTLEDLEKLQGVYDYVLEHNRIIVNGCDDSVVMVVNEEKIILRRARGYAPAGVQLLFQLKSNVLAMGANQKSTVAIGFDDQVILSPHIGDLDSIGSVEYYKKNIETLERIYNFKPEVIIHDKHPNYESTKVAQQLKMKNEKSEIMNVQHHYAHILGVMAEKQLTGKVFGVAFDGTGYGDDGNLWGGEFMVCDYEGYKRAGHLNYFKLMGGARAIKEPKRVALSLLFDLYGEEAFTLENPTIQAFTALELRTYYTAWEKGINAPLSSSAGRLFDAVASLLGICQVMSFEGESGMLLEAFYDDTVEGHFPFVHRHGNINVLPMIEAMMKEEHTNVAVSKFFHTLIEMISVVYEEYADLPMVCSGGVFQNRVLLDLLLKHFPNVLLPNNFPPNDGGIALGQVIATMRIKD